MIIEWLDSLLGGNREVSDKTPLPVSVTAGSSTTSSVSRVPTSTASVQLLAANGLRKNGYVVQNESAAVMYLLEGVGLATATNYTQQVPAGMSWSNDNWAGRVAAVLPSGTGNAQVTEYLP